MKKEIRISFKNYFCRLLGKKNDGVHVKENFKTSIQPDDDFIKENARDGNDNHRLWFRKLVIKLIAYYIFSVVTYTTLASITFSIIIKQLIDIKDPIVSWVGKSIESEGAAYGLLIASGNQNLVNALKFYYKRRHADYELEKFDQIERIIKSENSCK